MVDPSFPYVLTRLGWLLLSTPPPLPMAGAEGGTSSMCKPVDTGLIPDSVCGHGCWPENNNNLRVFQPMLGTY